MAALDWAIAKNPHLPRSLKATLNAMARYAEPDQEYANCFASQSTYAKFSGRGRRVVLRDIADLVHFGLVTERTDPIPGKWEASRGGEKRYQLWYDRITGFNADDRARYQERRRAGQSKPREKLRETLAKKDAEIRWLRDVIIERFNLELEAGVGYDTGGMPIQPGNGRAGYDTGVVSGTTQEPGVVPDTQSVVLDRPEDQTAAERAQRPVHAAENSGAPRAGSSSRSLRAGDPETRHRTSFAEGLLCEPDKLAPEKPEKRAGESDGAIPPTSQAAFLAPSSPNHADVLTEAGRKFLARKGEWHSVQLRQHLKALAIRLGLQLRDQAAVLTAVENTLYAQHRHFLESRRGASPPTGRGAVRGFKRGARFGASS